MSKIADIRNEYSKASLDIKTVEKDPIQQFLKWFDEAIKAEVTEVNAMALATINQQHRPSCRIVLLKGVEHSKFCFYTNYQSTKGRDLDTNPACALTFFWPELERQVRIEGRVERVTREESDAYFQVRPLGSRLGAWASPQSRVLRDRAELEANKDQIIETLRGAIRRAA